MTEISEKVELSNDARGLVISFLGSSPRDLRAVQLINSAWHKAFLQVEENVPATILHKAQYFLAFTSPIVATPHPRMLRAELRDFDCSRLVALSDQLFHLAEVSYRETHDARQEADNIAATCAADGGDDDGDLGMFDMFEEQATALVSVEEYLRKLNSLIQKQDRALTNVVCELGLLHRKYQQSQRSIPVPTSTPQKNKMRKKKSESEEEKAAARAREEKMEEMLKADVLREKLLRDFCLNNITTISSRRYGRAPMVVVPCVPAQCESSWRHQPCTHRSSSQAVSSFPLKHVG